MTSFHKTPLPTLLLSLATTLLLSASTLRAAHAASAPVIKVGQSVQVALKKKASADFVIGLPKGSFLVLCDTQSANGENIVQGSVKLLKANGAAIPEYSGSLLSWYESNSIYRDGKTIALKRPLSARLRIANSDLSDAKMWLKVVPYPAKQFVPFGFGATVTAAKIGANDGVGGMFKKDENRFYRVALLPGKWSLSLGIRPIEQAYVNATLRILNSNGLPTNYNTVAVENSTGEEARGEVLVSVKTPTTLILQARNRSNNGGDLEHDVTVSKE
jgi:hypothetical protein